MFTDANTATKKLGEACSLTRDCQPVSEGAIACADQIPAGSTGGLRYCQQQLKGKAGDGPCSGTVIGTLTALEIDFRYQADPLPTAYLCYIKDGLACSSETKKCERLSLLGEACTSVRCQTGLRCANGTCVTPAPLGADCTASNALCDDQTYCDEATQKCAPDLPTGAACTFSSQCVTDICAAGMCAPTARESQDQFACQAAP